MSVHEFRFLVAAAIVGLTVFARPAGAQLAECSQIDEAFGVDAEGGCIARSLADQIGAGQGDERTPGSSIYLIKRDPARSIRRGRQLFQRKFSLVEGHGPRVNPASTGDITATRALGAGLADSCAACHGRPRGSAGHGGDVATFPDSRDAPHLFGLGLIEMLADEMTAELRTIRDDDAGHCLRRASRATVRRGAGQELLRFRPARATSAPGQRRAPSSMRTDRSVAGSSRTASISVRSRHIRTARSTRPQWSASMSTFASGRSFTTGERCRFANSSSAHSTTKWDCRPGIRCFAPQVILTPRHARSAPPASSSTRRPTPIARPPACDRADDPDLDGVSGEFDPALIDHLEFYLLNYFKPATYRETPRTARGLRIMESIGCTSCHVRDLRIARDRRVADVETRFDPERGIMNDLFAEAEPLFVIEEDGDPQPLLVPLGNEFIVRNVFSDLKRHNLGKRVRRTRLRRQPRDRARH